MRTPTEEREVCVSGYTFNQDGTKAETLSIYTSDYSYMLKFDRFCKEYPDTWKAGEVMTCQGDVVGKKYTAATECILFRGRARKGTPQTEERRQAARERMERMHKEGRL